MISEDLRQHGFRPTLRSHRKEESQNQIVLIFALATCLEKGLQGHFFSPKATQTSSDIKQTNLVLVNSSPQVVADGLQCVRFAFCHCNTFGAVCSLKKGLDKAKAKSELELIKCSILGHHLINLGQHRGKFITDGAE